MAITAADLVARVTADTAGAARSIAGFGGNLLDLGAKAGLAIFGIKELGGALADTVQGFLAPAAEMERYQVQLGTLMGSAEMAKDRLAELAKFGAETPFELPELVRAEKVLQGFGLTGQKAFQMTGKSGQDLFASLGDIAAGTGASFEEIALNFGKFSAGATGEAISRFQEMGIATREQMAGLGIEFSKSGELLSPLPEAMQAVLKLTDQKFGGGMKALSTTFEGRLSTLQDAWGGLMRTLGTPLLAIAGPAIESLSNFLGGPVAELAEKAGPILAETIGSIGSSFGDLGPFVQIGKDAIQTFQEAMAGDWVTGEGINPLVNAIGLFASGLRNDILPAARSFFDWLTSVAVPAFQPIAAKASELASVILPALGAGFTSLAAQSGPVIASFINGIRPAMETVGSFITNTLIPGVQQIADVLGPVVGPALQHMGEAFGNLGSQLGPMGGTLAELGGAFGELGIALLPIAALVGGVMVAGFTASWEVLSGLLTGVPTVVKAVVQGLTEVVGGLAEIIGGTVAIVTNLLRGDWAGAWESAGRVVDGAQQIIVGIVTAISGSILGIMSGGISAFINLFTQLQPQTRDELMKVKATIIDTIQSIDMRAMASKIVQDMIDGIAGKFAGVQAILGQLRGLFPSSPAKWGPWSELPEWSAIFNSLPGALGDAAVQMEGVLASMRQDAESAAAAIVGQGGEFVGNIAASIAPTQALAAQTAAAGTQAESRNNGRNQAKADEGPKMPDTITVSVPVTVSDNTFGYGPDGLMRPEDWDRFADLLAPKVARLLAALITELGKS